MRKLAIGTIVVDSTQRERGKHEIVKDSGSWYMVRRDGKDIPLSKYEAAKSWEVLPRLCPSCGTDGHCECY